MYDTPMEAFIYASFDFIIGLLRQVFNAGFSIFIIFGGLYVVGRFLVCENDIEEWKELSGNMRAVMKDLIKSFRVAMPAVVESAKLWAEERLDEIKEAREERGRRER